MIVILHPFFFNLQLFDGRCGFSISGTARHGLSLLIKTQSCGAQHLLFSSIFTTKVCLHCQIIRSYSRLSSPIMSAIANIVHAEGTTTSFDQLVQDLSDALGPSSGVGPDDVDPTCIQDIMRCYQSDESQWAQYALPDLNRSYTRNLVDEGNGKSNLVSTLSSNVIERSGICFPVCGVTYLQFHSRLSSILLSSFND